MCVVGGVFVAVVVVEVTEIALVVRTRPLLGVGSESAGPCEWLDRRQNRGKAQF